MRMPLASRIIFYFMGIFLPVGSHIADYSQSHIFNPQWPPHAKFHTGQTLGFSILLGLLTIYFVTRKTTDKNLTVLIAVTCSSLYWVTQACAIFYPGTAFFDPQFDTASNYFHGIPAQLVVDTVALTLVAIATTIAVRKNARWIN